MYKVKEQPSQHFYDCT